MLRPAILALSVGGAVLLLSTLPVRAATAERFDPVAFFSGRTVGDGQLKKVFSSSQATRTEGDGVLRDGELVLEQTVQIAGEPSRQREWRLHAEGPGHWTGSLSDAKGPVDVRANGAVLTIRYTSNDNMSVAQTITLAPDGASAVNRMKISKLGLTVATINETIRRVPARR